MKDTCIAHGHIMLSTMISTKISHYIRHAYAFDRKVEDYTPKKVNSIKADIARKTGAPSSYITSLYI